MVLDVEGGELNLLDGFDLDKYRPRAILIEDQAMGRDTTVLDYLTTRGYEHVTWLSYNDYSFARTSQSSWRGEGTGAGVRACVEARGPWSAGVGSPSAGSTASAFLKPQVGEVIADHEQAPGLSRAKPGHLRKRYRAKCRNGEREPHACVTGTSMEYPRDQ